MTATEVVRARIDSKIKKEARDVFASMGLSVSDAIRLMFVRVAAEKSLPFEVRTPNTETLLAMDDVRKGNVTKVKNITDLISALDDD